MLKLASVLALVGSTAFAQECVSTSEAYESLADTYGEEPLVRMLMQDGKIIEMWGNAETGSWSLFVTHGNGLSCGLASGEGFVAIARKPNV